MSDLLVIEINHGDHVETVDVVNRGGFRALLAAHEAAEMGRGSGSQSVKRKYESFFDWYEKNHERVQLVFDSVEEKAIQMFPGIEQSCVSIEAAVENEQKLMVLRITAQGTADRTILGGLERADLAKQCTEKTVEGHTRWKRQGFDDLAFGAMKWKFLLRQLKGAYSVWEGGQGSIVGTKLSTNDRLSGLDEKTGCAVNRRSSEKSRDLVMRWKLDLSEGAERQRRRLLPNYEFHGLYNIDEDDETGDVQTDSPMKGAGAEQLPTPSYLPAGSQVEATADLLKDLNLVKYRSDATFDEFDDGDLDDNHTVATTGTVATASSTNDGASVATEGPTSNGDHSEHTDHEPNEVGEESSSYELINGLLHTGDHPERSYNVRRCTGLEVTKALLLWCRDAIYVVDGFEQTIGEGMEPKITRVEREQASYNVALRPKDFKVSDTLGELPGSGSLNLKRQTARSKSTQADSTSEVIYQHRSKRISFDEIYSVFRRRYQLQQNALEFFDVHRNGTLIAFDSSKESEEVLSKVLQSKLPNSIFWSSGSFVSYAKFMSNLKTKIQSQWASGKMTNFDFLMQMNSLAGRSFNDLTQYPVFPWIIADYDSEELDLNDHKSFRDLSKPMGGLGEERAKQFQERYEVLASTCETEDDPPPFHYGTHYSCAAYVLYYLMRLEPFSRLALALQGGKFDVADRLFHDIGRSWKSASEENLQDVRELIPEFFYLPDFLENTNNFDFGETQKGKTVHDVTLPKWAKGDPSLFVRMNRKALESTYVSKHLHLWVDLVFGCKQRGQPAVEALNTFVHVTYEGAVDLDAMDDPVQRASTIAQIQNFGQTPKQLDRRPFPARVVVSAVKDKVIDFGMLPALAPLTPPLCVVGAPHIVKIRSTMTDTAKLGMTGQSEKAVGDVWLYKGQLIGVGRQCSLIIDPRHYCRFGGMNNGVSLHTSAVSTRHREVDKLLSIHDGLHRAPVTIAKASFNGKWLVTGSVDSTLRVWQYDENRLTLQGTLCGHDGWPIKCIDISTEFGVIVTGCGRGIVILWDLRTLTFVRSLRRHENDCEQAVISVSINQKNGNILVLSGVHMTMFDINGNLIAHLIQDEPNRPSCAVATSCPEWMDQGIAAVSGHLSGEVRLWVLDYEKKQFILRHIMAENPHTSTITVLRVTGTERQDTLLIGDSSGKMSVCKTVQLDSFSPDELDQVIEEVSIATKIRDAVS